MPHCFQWPVGHEENSARRVEVELACKAPNAPLIQKPNVISLFGTQLTLNSDGHRSGLGF